MDGTSVKYLRIVRTIVRGYKEEKGGKNNKHKQEVVLSRTCKALAKLAPTEVKEFCFYQCKNKVIASVHNLRSNTANNIAGKLIKNDLPYNYIFGVFSAYMERNSENLNKYIQLKSEIEKSFLINDYKSALQALDEIDCMFGRSLWSLDTRLCVLATFERVDELKELQINISQSEDHLQRLLFAKHKSQGLESFMQQMDVVLREYRDNGRRPYADYISILLLPSHLDKALDLGGLVSASQFSHPLDRLHLYKKIASRYVHCDQVKLSGWAEAFLDFSMDASNYISDKSWCNFYSMVKGNASLRCSDKYSEILSKYTEGHYSDVVVMCETYIQENPTNLFIMDVHSKSLIFNRYEEEEFEDKTSLYYYQILLLLVSFLQDLDNYSTYKSAFETTIFRLLCFDFISTIKPAFLSAYPFISGERYIGSCRDLYITEFDISPKYLCSALKKGLSERGLDLAGTLKSIDYKLLPMERRSRLQIEINIGKDGDFTLESDAIISELENNNSILKSEYYYLWSLVRCRANEEDVVMSRLADECINKPVNAILYPLNKLVRNISDDRDIYAGNLDSVICFYLNFRLNDLGKRGEAEDVFEDYIESLKIGKPSQYLNGLSELSEKNFYFMAVICSQDFLSVLTDIETRQDLLIERIKIVQALIYQFGYRTDALVAEELSLFEAVVSENVVTHIANNKISIDVESIKKSKRNLYSSLLELIHFELVPDDEGGRFRRAEVGEEISTIPPLNFSGMIYSQVVADFVFNNDYGLVRCLSTEIRHGVLPTQIRSVLEASHLVTNRISTEEYQNNVYWREKYELTTDRGYLDFIDNNLAWFSKKADALIERANTWPVVTRDTQNQSAAFNLSSDMGTVEEFHKFVSGARDVDEFFTLIEEFVWRQIDRGFLKIKSLLNDCLKKEFNELFDGLTDRLNRNYDNIQLQAITGEIYNARNSITEEVSLIEGWFCRPKKNTFGEITVADAIDVSIKVIDGMYSPKIIVISKGCSGLTGRLTQKESLSLVRALVAMVQNAITHGCSANCDYDLEMDSARVGESVTINLINDVTLNQKNIIEKDRIIDRVKSYRRDGDNSLLSSEGGTGLYKTYRCIKDVFDDGCFSVGLTNFKFTQTIVITCKN